MSPERWTIFFRCIETAVVNIPYLCISTGSLRPPLYIHQDSIIANSCRHRLVSINVKLSSLTFSSFSTVNILWSWDSLRKPYSTLGNFEKSFVNKPAFRGNLPPWRLVPTLLKFACRIDTIYHNHRPKQLSCAVRRGKWISREAVYIFWYE